MKNLVIVESPSKSKTIEKYLGNSLKGTYTIFLNQIEQTNSEGKKFNNFVIDIVKAEDFNSNYQKNTNNSIVSTESQKTVDNPIQNQAEIVKTTKKETNSQTKNTTKKSTKVNTDNVVPITENEKVDSQAEQSQTTNEQNKQKTETYKEQEEL